MFSPSVFMVLNIFIASSLPAKARTSSPPGIGDVQNLTVISMSTTTNLNDIDIRQPKRIKCVVSRGQCKLGTECDYDFDMCKPDQDGTQNVCMAAGRLNGTVETLVWGCFTGTPIMTHCMSDTCNIQPRGNSSFICCCQSDYCNLPPKGWNGTMAPSTDGPSNRLSLAFWIALGIVPTGVFFVVICAIWLIQRHRPKCRLPEEVPDYDNPSLEVPPSEQPLISTNPLQGEIQLRDPIKNGEGRFGSVYTGCYVPTRRNDGSSMIVAIKVFDITKSQSWLMERAFYTSKKMDQVSCSCDNILSCSDRNILHFYGDNVVEDEGENVSQLWLITEYHRRGSLSNYLSEELLSLHELLTMCEGLAEAVEFLHNERPYAVAHRDIKSKNVLVKEDLTVCLADFGLALSFNKIVAENDKTQKGTRLYMAPEILQGAIDNFGEENYCPVDVYAMALVLWELLSRCSCVKGSVGPYKLPYTAELGDHPDGETLKDHVAINLQRPHFQEEWMQHRVLRMLCETIDDCWKPEPMVRIKAATVPYRLATMREAQKRMLDGSDASSTSSDSSGISDSGSGGNSSDVTLEIETNCKGAPGRIPHTRQNYDGVNQDSGIVRDAYGTTQMDMDCCRLAVTEIDSNRIGQVNMECNGMTPNGISHLVSDCNRNRPLQNVDQTCQRIPHSKPNCKDTSQVIMDCSGITQCQLDCRGQREGETCV